MSLCAPIYPPQMTMEAPPSDRGKHLSQSSMPAISDAQMFNGMDPTQFMNSTTYFKKDLLWKPLVRRFRRYLKKEALPWETYQRIFSKPVIKWGPHFCKAFNVPEPLRSDPRTQNAILMLVASHRIIRRKHLIFECRLFMAPYIDDIWPNFFLVFNDSNQRYRLKFFAEPLVHFLWQKFIADKPLLV